MKVFEFVIYVDRGGGSFELMSEQTCLALYDDDNDVIADIPGEYRAEGDITILVREFKGLVPPMVPGHQEVVDALTTRLARRET